jgi:hypothetical protein
MGEVQNGGASYEEEGVRKTLKIQEKSLRNKFETVTISVRWREVVGGILKV